MRLDDIHLILAEARKVSHHHEFVIAGSLSVLGLPIDVPDLMSHSIDVDYYPLRDPERASEIARTLGEGSKFHQNHGFYLDPIHPDLPILPRTWRSRIVRHDFGDVTAIFLDVNDTAISKYVRGAENDFRWIEAGYDAGILDIDIVTARAERETDFFDGERQPTLSRIRMHRLAMGSDEKLITPLVSYLRDHLEMIVVELDIHAGKYFGAFAWVDDTRAVQNIGDGRLAVHEVLTWKQKPAVGQVATVSYSDHGTTVEVQFSSIEEQTSGPD
ncbi:hypothetical protein PQR37_34415 [Paraburkholderia nemoris]|uniref:DUF6036 family nucleotidyltransferase n=1 Tax=Paraburkholderia TaxID=1822464 RepID=UPI0038B7F77F